MRLCGAGAGTGVVLRKGAVLGNGAGMVRVRVRFAGAGAGAVLVRVEIFAHFGVCEKVIFKVEISILKKSLKLLQKA